MKIINLKKKNMNYLKKQQEPYETQKFYYICQENFQNEYL